MTNYDFQIELEVRDYECDLQGIVNNSVYQNYLEYSRHKFITSVGLNFSEMHNAGLDAVVTRAELNYKSPLCPGDLFYVQIKISKQGFLRILFNQEIIRKKDNKLMLSALITTVLTHNGRPVSPLPLEEKFSKAGINI